MKKTTLFSIIFVNNLLLSIDKQTQKCYNTVKSLSLFWYSDISPFSGRRFYPEKGL